MNFLWYNLIIPQQIKKRYNFCAEKYNKSAVLGGEFQKNEHKNF